MGISRVDGWYARSSQNEMARILLRLKMRHGIELARGIENASDFNGIDHAVVGLA